MYRLLGTRGHTILEWISKDSKMPVFYDRVWARFIQWTELNYTQTRLHNGLLETSLFHLVSQNCFLLMQMDFFWNIQEDFPRDLTNTGTCY